MIFNKSNLFDSRKIVEDVHADIIRKLKKVKINDSSTKGNFDKGSKKDDLF